MVTFYQQASQSPTEPPLILRDMAHMAQFVYDFYRDRVQQLMSQQGVGYISCKWS